MATPLPASTLKKRTRKLGSLRGELLKRSKEAAMAAIQTFNSPGISFKSEAFITLMVISWTYLLHAKFIKDGVDYRHCHPSNGSKRKNFVKTKTGKIKHWELETCLEHKKSEVTPVAKKNLLFLIGLRHEIEHQMSMKVDEHIHPMLQACCLNYNQHLKSFFGDAQSIEKLLPFSLQLSTFGQDQTSQLHKATGLPDNIKKFIGDFQRDLAKTEIESPEYAFRVYFKKITGTQSQADHVIQFVEPNEDTLLEDITQVFIHEKERKKYKASDIVAIMNQEGFADFHMYHHTELFRKTNAKSAQPPFGVLIEKRWFWYKEWIPKVRAHCIATYGK